MVAEDSFDLKEECSSGVSESSLVSEDGKCLTGKTGRQDVVLGDVDAGDFRDVTVGFFAKVGLIRSPGIMVPFGRENALGTRALEPDPYTPDARKKIYEPWFATFSLSGGSFHLGNHTAEPGRQTSRLLSGKCGRERAFTQGGGRGEKTEREN